MRRPRGRRAEQYGFLLVGLQAKKDSEGHTFLVAFRAAQEFFADRIMTAAAQAFLGARAKQKVSLEKRSMSRFQWMCLRA